MADNPLLHFSPDGGTVGFDTPSVEEEEDEEEDKAAAKGERMLSWGVKKWLTENYTPTKSRGFPFFSPLLFLPFGV
jgi:hypothetical protein